MKKISLLIPAYNEEQSLHRLYDELKSLIDDNSLAQRYEFEVLVIDDGSRDRTPEILAELRANDVRFNYITLSRNFGKENALLAGFDNVTGDCTVILDADLQHPVGVIPEMIKLWEEGYDDVYGQRRSRHNEWWLRRKLSLAYYKLLQRATKFEVQPNVGDFRLLDKSCIETLRTMRETQRYNKGLFSWIGYKKRCITFECAERVAGGSKFSLFKLFNLAVTGITSFSTAPLRLATVLGLFIAGFALLYFLVILFKTIFFGEVIQGFPTLICTMLILGGVQLITIGIIGEYVGQIYNETKRRPPYIIARRNGEKI